MWDLGHSSLSMTNYYASLADQNRMKRHRQYSYMEQFAGAGATRLGGTPEVYPIWLKGQ
jgi:hypothetical protein